MYSEDLIYFIKRSGTDINPFVDITEEIVVDYGRAFLKEIPSESFNVSAKNGLENMVLVDSADKILSSSDFYVDFKQGIVHLHSSINGIKIIFKYKGIGVLLYPSSRIYVEDSNDKNVYTTLKDFIEQGKKVLEKVDDINDAVIKAELVSAKLNEIIDKVNNISNVMDSKVIEIDKLISDSKLKLNNAILDFESYGKDKIDEKILEISNSLSISLTKIAEEEIIRNANELIRKENEEARKLSELTRIENESRRILLEEQRNTDENVRKSSELTRISNEDIRLQNENKRIEDISLALSKANESIVKSESSIVKVDDKILEVDNVISVVNTNEEDRKLSESNRVLLENQRILDENDRKLSESERKINEESRILNENTRLSNEEKRIKDIELALSNSNKAQTDAENSIANIDSKILEIDGKVSVIESDELIRKNTENERLASESQRILDETIRIASESQRIIDENARLLSEIARISNEDARISDELIRKTSENERLSNEEVRKLNENIRIESQNQRIEDFKTAIESYNKSNIEIQEVLNKANENVSQLDTKIVEFDLNELIRKNAENDRILAENQRVLDENIRILAENQRVLDESDRKISEEARRLNEANREISETVRLTNEDKRIQTMKDIDVKVNDFTVLLNSTKYISEFNVLSQYEKNNIVSYNGSSFIAKKSTKGNIPIGNNADLFWGTIAQRGIDGEGSVSSVNGVFPDLEGNVTLDAHNLGFVSLNDLGVPEGVATLDKSGKLLESQLPDLTIYETVTGSQEKINALELSLKDYSIPKTDLGIPNGVARINQNGKVIDGNGNEVEGKITSVNGQIGDVILDLFSGNYEDLINKPFIPQETIINDSLISISTTEGLSANQGRILNEKIDTKSDLNHTHAISEILDLETSLNEKATKDVATNLNDGLMSISDKTKLDNIELEANKTTINDTLISISTTEGLSANQGRILDEKINIHEAKTDIHVTSEEKEKWNNKSDFNGSYNDLTDKPLEFNPIKHNHEILDINSLQSTLDSKAENILSSNLNDGLMSISDKTKLDGIEIEANKTIINDTLTSILSNEALSSNQGRILDEKINTHEAKTDIHITSEERISWNNKSDFNGDYNDLLNKPTIPDISGKADKIELHNHTNKTVLDKLTELDGNILFDGKEIVSDLDGELIIEQSTPPTEKREGMIWLDTSDDTFQGTIFDNLSKIKIGDFIINYDNEKQSLNFTLNGINILTINSNGIQVNGIITEE